MKLNIISIVLMLGLAASASAQNKSKARQKAKAQTTITNPRIEQQLQAVECVTFIDSIVVPQKELYKYINLGQENGRVMPAKRFLGIEDSLDCSMFETQLHNTIIYARPKANSTCLELVQIDSLVAEGWSEPESLNGLNTEDSYNYPYLMADGQTLYFAAQGGESLGGYDIYMTRYDYDSKTWLTPQSIGMPFNSTSNDYLYMIDDYNGLGYFVTDRHQKAGDVCIYTFIPNNTRNIYDPEATPHEQLVSLAEINCIGDTQADKAKVAEALKRKKDVR